MVKGHGHLVGPPSGFWPCVWLSLCWSSLLAVLAGNIHRAVGLVSDGSITSHPTPVASPENEGEGAPNTQFQALKTWVHLLKKPTRS
ncbi:hypothetical protein C8R47DRAFT_1135376 [Mycena vitilis]|nr:hypothetical protein C8R47DRAFT_1135376 [Mycena vitilis]